jgi:acetylornithine deacetylase/succinyl-diaminopimelate desuccinylase-like protein
MKTSAFWIARITGVNLPAIAALALLPVAPLFAQGLPEQVRRYRIEHEADVLREFFDLLSIPNVASDKPNIRRNADLLVKMLEKRGFRARLLPVDDAPPAVFGELVGTGARKTVAFYAHYDGQPADPTHWAGDPWKPVLRDRPLEEGGKEIPVSALGNPGNSDARLYARSTSDDKAPIIAILAALDALRANNLPPSVNIKVLFEGEEEAGSPHLSRLFEQYKDMLKADLWLLCDGPVHQTRKMQLYFGARGVEDLEITVFGPGRALHSGHYGNWAPNPVILLAELLSSMRDSDGTIRIADYYDDVKPPSAAEKQALSQVPNDDAELKRELGLAWNEGGNRSLAELITLPALNLRGIQAGHVGAATTNAIPTEAVASIDFRLVPDQTPERVRALVENHITRQGFYVVHEKPSLNLRLAHPKIVLLDWGVGYPAARTPMDLPAAGALVKVIQKALGEPIVKMPTLGGSVPMYLFVERLKAPVIGLPIANHDNNQHSANENLRLQNLWDGIDVFAGIISGLGIEWR